MAVTMKEILDKLDGIKSTGLAELADAGLPKSEWLIFPKNLLKAPETKVIEESKKANAFVEAVGKDKNFGYYKTYADKESEKFVAPFDGKQLCFNDGGKVELKYPPISDKEWDAALSTILAHNANLEKDDKIMRSTFNFVIIVKGWAQFSMYDEVMIKEAVKDADKDLSDCRVYIESHVTDVIALSIAAAISHWMTNHTIGSMNSNNLVSKVFGFCGLRTVRSEKGANLNKMLYKLVHQVNKRNALFAIAPRMIGISALHSYGFILPATIEIDKSYAIRINTVPAGNRHVEIAYALVLEMQRNKLIACSDAYNNIDEIVEKILKIKSNPLSAHIGASYYTRYTENEATYRDYNSASIDSTIRSYGSILSIIDPDHTLSMSPIVKSILITGRDLVAEANAKTFIKVLADARKAAVEEMVKSAVSEAPADLKAIDTKVNSAIKKVADFISELDAKNVAAKKVVQDEELKV